MKKNIIFILITSLSFMACGGSNSTPESEYRSIEGKVIDAAVENASVSLRCNNSIYNAETLTNEEGYFKINNIPKNKDLSACTLFSLDGNDGDALRGLELKADYSLFKNNKIFITPITSMLSFNNISKKDLASFLNLEINDLIKNPEDNIKIAKIAKKITRVFLLKDKSHKKIGLINLNNTRSNNLNEYINELDISEKDIKYIIKTFKLIDESKTIKDIRKQSILATSLSILEKMYKQQSYSDEFEKNLILLASKIIEANKKENKLQTINFFHIKKALADLSLSPIFTNNTLDEKLVNLLSNKNDFEKYLKINEKDINIKNINSLIIYDVKNYKKILGDDNQSRIEYYTFSDISYSSKALKLLEDSYNDLLLMPAYEKIASSYAKLGFFQEAENIIENTIYSKQYKISAYLNLSKILIRNKNNINAKKMLDKSFFMFKTYLLNKDSSTINEEDTDKIITLYYAYSELKYLEKAQEVIDFISQEVLTDNTENEVYLNIAAAFRNKIYDLLNDKNLYSAKIVLKQALIFLEDIPTPSLINAKDTAQILIEISKAAAILSQKDSSEEVLNILKKNDHLLGTYYSKINAKDVEINTRHYASFAGEIVAIKALNGELDEMLKLVENDLIYSKFYNSLSNENHKAISEGIALKLFLEGKKQEAINLIYKHRFGLEYETADYNLGNRLFMNIVSNSPSKYTDMGRILKAFNPSLMKEFYVMLVNDMKTRPWDNNTKDIHINENILGNSFGLLPMIKNLNEENFIKTRNDILNTALSLVEKMKDPIYKLSSYIRILKSLSDNKINDLDDSVLENIKNKITNLNSQIVLSNTSGTYHEDFIKVIEQIKNMSYYGFLDVSKSLSLKAKNSIPSAQNGNKNEIMMKLHYSLGSNPHYDAYNSSLLSALIQSKSISLAKELISELSKDIETLGESLDSYELYQGIVRSYAAIGDMESLQITLDKIKTFKEKDKATIDSINYLSNYDAFINSNIAFVDTDNDGKPDFFSKNASKEDILKSGLILDDDIDGDGILDIEDFLPFYKN